MGHQSPEILAKFSAKEQLRSKSFLYKKALMLIKAFKFLQHLTPRDQITSYSGNAAHSEFISGSADDCGYTPPLQPPAIVTSTSTHTDVIIGDSSISMAIITAVASRHPAATCATAAAHSLPTADCTTGAMALSHIFFGDAPEASAGNISTANTIIVRIYIGLFLCRGLERVCIDYLHSARYVEVVIPKQHKGRVGGFMMDGFHAVTNNKFTSHIPSITWTCLD
jgi:hypothetical protein